MKRCGSIVSSEEGWSSNVHVFYRYRSVYICVQKKRDGYPGKETDDEQGTDRSLKIKR